MTINLFILRIIIILFPGFIGYKVYKKLCNAGFRKNNIKNWEDFINILSISLFSYFIMKFFSILVKNLKDSNLFYKIFSKTTMLDALLNSKIVISYQEIFISMLIAILLGLIGAIFYNKKLIFRLLYKLNISQHFGDDDVWTYFHNSDSYEWVSIRDLKTNLTYTCSILAFSDYGEKRELLIKNVDVFDSFTTELLYKTDTLYLCRDNFDLIIETIPKNKKGGKDE